jgi:hypothetical protein
LIPAAVLGAVAFGSARQAPAPAGGTSVLESLHIDQDFEPSADATKPHWRIPGVSIGWDYFGKPIDGSPTEVRSRWTDRNLYFLFICPYAGGLNLKPSPDPLAETPQLWNWDVAEVFIGWDADHIGRYKELQVSPQSEWVDLDIDRDNSRDQEGMRWNSGYSVKGWVDDTRHVWYGEMRIPFSAIDTRPPQTGRELRLGLFRIAGSVTKLHYAWRPTGQASFHVPQAFGTLKLR